MIVIERSDEQAGIIPGASDPADLEAPERFAAL